LGGATWQSGGLPTGTSLEELREGARRLFRSNEVNPDPNTSGVVTTAALLALFAKHRLGVGQEVFVDMMGANAYANADDFFWYEDREPRPDVDADLMGTGPLYRLYRCKEGWVFLGIMLDKEWLQFCRRIGSPELAVDPRFNTRLAREENAEALTALLEELFTGDTADEWEKLLTVAGIGCVRADGPTPGQFWHEDEHIRINEYKVTVHHSRHGEMERHGPVVRLRQTPNRIASAPLAGEQTDEILEELGYPPDEIARLRESGIVWAEEGVPTPQR
jgi:crotonobetainyl-CoA:carnitine CoA-transferase CaiB-like acyl-CoA transferase